MTLHAQTETIRNSITVQITEGALDVEVRLEHDGLSSRELINAAALAADTAVHAMTRPVTEIVYHHADEEHADTKENPILITDEPVAQ